jgi:PAS domain-containing protein
VSTTPQKQLVLVLARAFASNLSTPALLADARGHLVYYNEAAELVVGKRFAEIGELPIEEWLDPFAPRASTGELLPREQRPTWIALNDRRPAHLRYMVTSADGVEREIEVSAFPLFAHAEEFVGAIVLFWRRLPWLSA